MTILSLPGRAISNRVSTEAERRRRAGGARSPEGWTRGGNRAWSWSSSVGRVVVGVAPQSGSCKRHRHARSQLPRSEGRARGLTAHLEQHLTIGVGGERVAVVHLPLRPVRERHADPDLRRIAHHPVGADRRVRHLDHQVVDLADERGYPGRTPRPPSARCRRSPGSSWCASRGSPRNRICGVVTARLGCCQARIR